MIDDVKIDTKQIDTRKKTKIKKSIIKCLTNLTTNLILLPLHLKSSKRIIYQMIQMMVSVCVCVYVGTKGVCMLICQTNM